MEEAIFRNGNIEVTKTMAKFGNITYPIAGIGSVSVTAPDRIGGYVLSVAIAIGGWNYALSRPAKETTIVSTC
jgi:hypothetical protein